MSDTIQPDALFMRDLSGMFHTRDGFGDDLIRDAKKALVVSNGIGFTINASLGGLALWGATAALSVGTVGWLVVGALLVGFGVFELICAMTNLVALLSGLLF